MVVLQLDFIGNSKSCSAEVELEGIADSWNAYAKISGHPTIHELHVKFWLEQFLTPIFSSKEDAIFFEPLLEAIDEHAKRLLPKEFK